MYETMTCIMNYIRLGSPDGLLELRLVPLNLYVRMSGTAALRVLSSLIEAMAPTCLPVRSILRTVRDTSFGVDSASAKEWDE